MKWLAILGIGEDGVEGLSSAARGLLNSAHFVVGGARHLALAEPLIRGGTLAWPSPLTGAFPAILARRGQPVVVLASGDPYCHGVGAALRAAVPVEETICVPQPSSFALARARLGWAAQDVATISFCGHKLEYVRPLLHPGRQILALSADAGTPARLCALLRADGFGPSRLTILEALGGPQERVRAITVEAGPPGDVGPLNILALEVRAGPDARIIPLASGLSDEVFEHDGQLTKSEVRAVTLAALAPRVGEMLWDIGAGAGSIGIEWMLRHRSNHAIGIEVRPDRAARAARNALALGVPDLRIVVGKAPPALADLPMPHAIFIGGGGQDAGVMEAALRALRPGGRIVANAVTIETEAILFAAHAQHGGTLSRISIDRLETIGDMRAFRRAMMVTQWKATKPWAE